MSISNLIFFQFLLFLKGIIFKQFDQFVQTLSPDDF